MRTDNASSNQGRPAPARDVPLSLAEAVVSCLALRDIPRLRAHYPSAMRAEDAAELRASLTGHLRAALADSRFDDLRSHDRGLNLDAPATDEDLTALLFALLLRVPGTLPSAPNREIAPDAMRMAVAACQDRIGPPLKDIVTQLGEIKLFDCRIPEGDPTFLDPRRSLQLLRAYWSVCRSLVLHQIDAPIGYQPHPLRRTIVSLRARIGGHLARLGSSEGGEEAKGAIDILLDTILGGDPDDLSAAPEWTRQQVQTVEAYLEDVRLNAGSKVFPLTHEEEVFLTHAEGEVRGYHQQVKEAWARMLATAQDKAQRAAGAAPVPSAAGMSSTGAQPGVGGSTGAPAGEPREKSTVHPGVAEPPGQPCLGLAPSPLRLVRAYQDWEARREKRHGLPAAPTVDDLVAETELARATVIKARLQLTKEQLLEQVPGARAGTLRLTQKGLQLRCSSTTTTVQPTVQ